MGCHITYTNQAVHDLIRANLHRAPMYSGQIAGRGPRYCPSVEDKVVRFADKERHQIFLEPEGRDTLEYYCNGISTSLPKDVQHAMLRQIPGWLQLVGVLCVTVAAIGASSAQRVSGGSLETAQV